jgi:hypothetical protein
VAPRLWRLQPLAVLSLGPRLPRPPRRGVRRIADGQQRQPR